ncbi:MAG: methyltransferase domain-containing protein, partial [Micromonosporaceae bacterium]
MIAALRTPEGEAALAQAAGLSGKDPLAAVAALRSTGATPEIASAALTQIELRGRAAGKFGADASRMFFTRDGLQQATRGVVAERRATRLASDPAVRRVADLCCGVGADAIALGRAGLTVHAVDTDPATVEVARANVEILGLTDRVTVDRADAMSTDLSGYDAVFCDPARRTGGRRVFDPAAYSPSWEFLSTLAERVPRTVLKLGPGIDHALIPYDTEAEFVSVAGDVVEATLWHGPLAAVPRRATLVGVGELTGTGQRTGSVGPVRSLLYDPDGAV